MNNKLVHTHLLGTYFLTAAFLILFGSTSIAQNEVKNYEPPPVIKGSELQAEFNSDFSSIKQTKDSSGSYNINLHSYLTYNKWRLTRKLNYALSLNTYLSFNKSRNSSVVESDLREYTSSGASFVLNGGVSYYYYRNFYAGVSSYASSRYNLHYSPLSDINFFPSAGYGRLVNADQVPRSANLEKALMEEKTISAPLPVKVKKELVEILDRKNNREFYSLYRANEDIEFYSAVEKLLIDNNIINSPLGSRAVLKMYQALTNSNFVYFPKYKGWQIQAEAGYSVIADPYFSDNPDSRLTTVTLAGIYGLPLSDKLSSLFSLFYSRALSGTSLPLYDNYMFHSPTTIAESNHLGYNNYNLVPNSWIFSYKYNYKYSVSAVINLFYNLSRFAGINIAVQGDIAGTDPSGTLSSFHTDAQFKYYILSKLSFDANISFVRDYDTNYSINGGIGISYIIF